MAAYQRALDVNAGIEADLAEGLAYEVDSAARLAAVGAYEREDEREELDGGSADISRHCDAWAGSKR